MQRFLRYALIFISAMGAGAISYQWQLNRASTAADPQRNAYTGYVGGDFKLNSYDGEVSLSDFKGQAVLIYFGYTYCPDVCPNSLAVMAEAMNILEEEIPVKGLLISIDPERDTLEKLNSYAPHFHPNITGLSSDVHRLLEVSTRYGVFHKQVEREENDHYLVDHTSRIYVVDSDSKLAGVINHGASATEVAQRVRDIQNKS